MHCKRSKLLAVVSEHDLKRLISHTASDGSLSDLHDAVTIVKNTGVRPGELARLRWSDIDMEQRQFICKGTSRSTRLALFTSETSAILLARRQRNPDAEFVFSPAVLQGGRLSRQLRKVSASLGISPCTFRMLRRNFAMCLANSGTTGPHIWSLYRLRYESAFKVLGSSGDAKSTTGIGGSGTN